MFLINQQENKIEKLKQRTFTELGLKERENLQEWFAKNPNALGEELLIIQKEFSGFTDTKERLDLLALDKRGNLVIIENKLDDSGKNVTWQCLKYASYCSSLKKSQIVKIFQEYLDKNNSEIRAEEAISEFLDDLEIEEISLNSGTTQRMILVSGNFRKEVTSTVIWLLNYGLRIQCFQATPYSMGNHLFLNVDQIIPTKESVEYSISIAEKTQEEIASQEELKNRHIYRLKYWNQILKEMNSKSELFSNISAGKYNWIGAGSGVRGVGFNFSASKKNCKAELYIDRGIKEENEFIFNLLLSRKELIEKSFGGPLDWERLEAKRACRIKYEDETFDIFDEDTWSNTIPHITSMMVKLNKAIKPHLKEINQKVKAM